MFLQRATPSSRLRKAARNPYVGAALVAAGALATSAYLNHVLAERAERANPPKGKFLEVNGVRLHFVERGDGDALILLHGNSSMVEDFETSGLIDLAAKSYRVIAFDRPGFGYSERPRSTVWTADAQADLIHDAMVELGVKSATVFGHSWGASVAVSLALRHPDAVGALVLASGYYYPTFRADLAVASAPAIPIIGDVLRYAIWPWLGRAMWPQILRKMFGPSPAPAKFDGFPAEMLFRPATLLAGAAESALMIPDAVAAQPHYAEIKMPVAIVAGDADKILDTALQSARLHEELPHSTFDRVAGVGHMIHQIEPERVLYAIDKASGRTSRPVTSAKGVAAEVG